jgi:hypothetical protein
MEMTSLEMPPSKLSELVGGRSSFTTEEIIQVASQLCDGESIDCGVKITPVVLLSVHLDNKNSANVSVNFRVMNPRHMRRNLVLDVNHHSIRYHHSFQRAGIGHRPFTGDSYNLRLEDVVNIFDLGDSVIWHLYGHGTSNASMASRHEQRWW